MTHVHRHHPALWARRQSWQFWAAFAAILAVGTAWTAGWL